MSDITLYADAEFTSPWVMSVFVALTEKGIPFRLEPVSLKPGPEKADRLAKVSPTRRVPVLVHDDFRLVESSAITEYLEESFPAPNYAPIYPAEKNKRALARQVQAWVRSDFSNIRQERSMATIFLGQPVKPLSEIAQAEADRLLTLATALLPSGEQDLFGAWCIADVDLAVMLWRLVFNGDPVPVGLRAYVERQCHRPSARKWLDLPR